MAEEKSGSKARIFEDKLLKAYWEEVGGILYMEVPIGSTGADSPWPKGSRIRKIDGVRIRVEDPAERKFFTPESYKSRDIQATFHDKDVEVIEVKRRLNRVVFGQAIAGVDMFERQYRPRNVIPVVLYAIEDPAMEWVCRKHGVNTIKPTVDKSGTGEKVQ